MNYTDFKKQADLDNMIYRIGSKFDNSGYRNPLLGASNSIKAKAPLLTAPTVQDKTDFMNVAKKAPAQQRANWFLNPGDSNLKLPVEQSPREYVQANLYDKATTKPTWRDANQNIQPQTMPASHYAGRMTESQVKQQQLANQPTQQQASNSIFDKNTFNNDRINNIKDPEQLDAYMDFVLKGGFGAQQLQDTDYDLSKMTIADIANNPNAISGLSDALENSSQEARESFLRVTKQYQEAMNNKGGDASNPATGNAAASTSGTGSMSQENMDKIKGSFLKGAWNDIKKDPIGMIPQIASMFLKYIGAGDGISNFFKNPWGFYGTLATLLLGGGMLLSGGSDDDKKPVVNNYYNQPAGYNRIPYT